MAGDPAPVAGFTSTVDDPRGKFNSALEAPAREALQTAFRDGRSLA